MGSWFNNYFSEFPWDLPNYTRGLLPVIQMSS